jgi:hypothetical protein
MIDIIVTVDMMMEKRPCPEWPRERVAAYLSEGKTLTAMLRDALANNGISIPDAIWGVTRFLPDKINRAFAIWCARKCETNVKEIADYIDTIERYYAGKATKDELKAAYGAAYGAHRKLQAERLIEMIDAVEGE